MSDLRDVYQEMILDHNRNPRNYGKLEHADCQAEGFNPLCGDKLELYIRFDADGVIEEVVFEGHGCAISTASASMMTEALKGKTVKEAEALFSSFREQITDTPSEECAVDLGKLKVFAGVKEFPSRVKCAALAWHTLHAALKGEKEATSTE